MKKKMFIANAFNEYNNDTFFKELIYRITNNQLFLF